MASSSSSTSGFADVDFPVFADTSLGTHMAMAISPHITVGDFARELKREHLNCFPKVGEIRINELMVKHKSYFYSLPESLLMKYVFQGVKGTRFVYIKACTLSNIKKPCLRKCTSQQIVANTLNIAVVPDTSDLVCCVTSTNNDNLESRTKRRIPKHHSVKSLDVLKTSHLSKEKRKKREKKNFVNHLTKGLENGHAQRIDGSIATEWLHVFPDGNVEEKRAENTCSKVEMSDTLSVSNIIKKYFISPDELPSDSEVNSRKSSKKISQQLKAGEDDKSRNINLNKTPPYIASTPQRVTVPPYHTQPRSLISINMSEREVGKRVVLALDKIRISASKQTTGNSACRLRQRKLSLLESTSVAKSLLFDISDDDD